MPLQVFALQPYKQPTSMLPVVIITPEPVELETVSAAWAYAVRYTAKGLDLPDHEAAKKIMAERHPSWTFLDTVIANVPVKLELAENDTPE